jgi:hypothetical protein
MTDDDVYEPDAGEIAYMIAQEREIASLRQEYHRADRELCDYQKHTDRQLRAMSRKKKGCARRLARAYQFDVVSGDFEVEIAEDVWVSAGGPFDDEETVPRVLTRKDKRRERKAARFLRNRRAQWEKSRAASMVRKTGALSPMVAGVCHA